MAIKWKSSLNGTGPIMRSFPVNDNQTIVKSSLVVLASNKASVAADAASAGTVLGVSDNAIATTTATATDLVYLDVNPASIYEMDYLGTGTPTIGTSYDFYDAVTFDVADSTNGYIQVIGNIDTVNKKADVMLTGRTFGVS